MGDEQVARLFHDTYEKMAPSFGYETRSDTKEFNPQSPNGQLMIAVCKVVSDALTAENAELWKRVEALEGSLKSMRRYSAVQGRLDDGEELAGLAYDGSIWGPCADPKYEMYELAESVEKWLHEKIDTALSQRKVRAYKNYVEGGALLRQTIYIGENTRTIVSVADDGVYTMGGSFISYADLLLKYKTSCGESCGISEVSQ